MSDKTRNPFVVEVEHEAPKKEVVVESSSSAADKPEVPKRTEPIIKMVIKPDSSTFVPQPPIVKPPSLVDVSSSAKATADKPKKPVEQKPSVNRVKPQWGMFFAGMGTMLLITGAAAGGWWWMNGQKNPLKQAVEPSPTPTTLPTVAVSTPTPTPTVAAWSRGSISVDVLNGSGITGEATKIASQIQKLGYKKGETGNAANQTGSTISFGPDVATLSAVIKEDLSSIIPGLAISNEVLKGTGKVVVRIGK